MNSDQIIPATTAFVVPNNQQAIVQTSSTIVEELPLAAIDVPVVVPQPAAAPQQLQPVTATGVTTIPAPRTTASAIFPTAKSTSIQALPITSTFSPSVSIESSSSSSSSSSSTSTTSKFTIPAIAAALALLFVTAFMILQHRKSGNRKKKLQNDLETQPIPDATLKAIRAKNHRSMMLLEQQQMDRIPIIVHVPQTTESIASMVDGNYSDNDSTRKLTASTTSNYTAASTTISSANKIIFGYIMLEGDDRKWPVAKANGGGRWVSILNENRAVFEGASVDDDSKVTIMHSVEFARHVFESQQQELVGDIKGCSQDYVDSWELLFAIFERI
ncbi:hypothetical protein BDR26DRAFT_898062 [Obelidium mucronatum]|nr:hypothetical protein BDR26DRAFT_898062 [Obelidium mucronatum]